MSTLEPFIAGYHRFRRGYYQQNREQLMTLAQQGQSPKVAVVACCDSRVDPSLITDSMPGDMFVIRNVANLVPPCEGEGSWHGTSAALQFAVCGLQVEHIIVLGHAQCGGIRSLVEGGADSNAGDFIASWMSIADSAKQAVLQRAELTSIDEQAHACEHEAIKVSLQNLRSFPWVQQRLDDNTLQLHGWYYDMRDGSLLALHEQSGVYVAV